MSGSDDSAGSEDGSGLGLKAWLDRYDPTRYATHRGIRAAIAVTFALPVSMLLVDNAQFRLFAAFGALSLIIFVDFPGNRRVRGFSYLTLSLVGMVLIALGTLASGSGWVAVAGMAVAGFGVLFAGVLSSAAAAAGRALLLAFVLPVTVPATAIEILPRLGGWGLGMAVAIPLALFVWPPREHADLRIGVSRTCLALARSITGGPDPVVDAQTSEEALKDLKRRFRASVSRPIGLSAGSRLLARVIRDLDWLHAETRGPSALGLSIMIWPPDLAPGVTQACADGLTAASAALDQPTAANREQLAGRLGELTNVRNDALHRWLGKALTDRPPVDLSAAERLHSLAYATDLAGRNVAAALAADARTPMDKVLGRGSQLVVAASLQASTRLARHHLSWQSVWLHNSLRGALGMALAVLLAQVTEVSHGFWVALGAMSVLRSSALNTGATAFRALLGTLVGVIVGAGALLLLGDSPLAWLVLPVSMFFAGFANDAISFAAGQAAFSIAVLIMFSLLGPAGWEVGLVRLENVAIGAGAALAVGLLLWPRGAGGAIRRAIAQEYRWNAKLLINAVQRLTERPAPAAVPDADVLGAAFRLDDALRQYLADRGAKSAQVEDLIAVSVGAERVRLTAGALAELANRATPAGAAPDTGPVPVGPELAADLRHRRERQAHWLGALAQELTDQLTGVPPAPPADAVADVLDHARRDPAGSQDLEVVPAGVWAAIHLDDLARHERHVVPRVSSLVSGRHSSTAVATATSG